MKHIAAILLIFNLMVLPLHAADYTVCSGDCDYSLMSNAIAGVSATDTIQIAGDLTEGVVWNRPCAMIWMDKDKGYVWSWAGTGSAATCEIQSGMNQAATMKGVIIDCPTGNYTTIYIPTTGASEHLWFDDCIIKRTSTTAGPIMVNDNGNMANLCTFTKTKLIGNSSTTYGIRFRTATAAGAVSFFSSLIYGCSTGTALSFDQPSANTVAYIVNGTVDGNAVGISSGAAMTVVNTAFTNNTDDVSLSNNAAFTQFTYCAFQEQPTVTAGAGCVFGISGTQYVNRAAYNFQLLSSSALCDAGSTNTLGTPDLLGTARPVGSAYDIGAYEYTSSSIGGGKRKLPIWWYERYL